MTTLDALLFDVDGTLADTERDGHRPAFNMAFEEAGLDWHWDEALYGQLLEVTGGKERIKHYLARFNPTFKAPADLDGFVAQLHQCKTRHFTELMADGRIPLRPGVERLIDEARASGLRLGIATTTTPANVEALLHYTLGAQALDWFEVIAAGDVVPAKKPAPDIYQYALQHMHLDPRQCLAFEDSAHGLRASQGAGLATIVTVNGYTREQAFPGALLVLDQFGEPGSSFHVLAGEPPSATMLDVAGLRQLHRCAIESESEQTPTVTTAQASPRTST